VPYLRQFLNEERSCASYMIGCPTSGEALVVDPKEDIQEYLVFAQSMGAKITRVIDTHIHADHYSGASKLAKETGAELLLFESARVNFEYAPLRDGEVVRTGNAELRVMHTPGHTPESVCLMYVDKRRSDSVWTVLTGDTLFVGDVGRLDLIGGGTVEDMYSSIFNKLLRLEDYTEIYPAHYAGSACGRGMSLKTFSTIGYEKRFNPALKAKSFEEFADYVGTNRPKPIPDHQKIKLKNMGL
jgi:hydroxyacylglutathione hydrolase